MYVSTQHWPAGAAARSARRLKLLGIAVLIRWPRLSLRRWHAGPAAAAAAAAAVLALVRAADKRHLLVELLQEHFQRGLSHGPDPGLVVVVLAVVVVVLAVVAVLSPRDAAVVRVLHPQERRLEALVRLLLVVLLLALMINARE